MNEEVCDSFATLSNSFTRQGSQVRNLLRPLADLELRIVTGCFAAFCNWGRDAGSDLCGASDDLTRYGRCGCVSPNIPRSVRFSEFFDAVRTAQARKQARRDLHAWVEEAPRARTLGRFASSLRLQQQQE